MAGVISKLADDRQALFDKFGKQNSFRMDDYTKIFQEANSQRLYGYLPDLQKLQKDLAQHNVIDVEFDRELKGIREWANEDGKFPQANNSYQTTVQYLRDFAILITKVANEVPQH